LFLSDLDRGERPADSRDCRSRRGGAAEAESEALAHRRLRADRMDSARLLRLRRARLQRGDPRLLWTRTAVGQRHLHRPDRASRAPRSPARVAPGLPALVTRSALMRALAAALQRYARADANALVTREHGVGQDLVRRLLQE